MTLNFHCYGVKSEELVIDSYFNQRTTLEKYYYASELLSDSCYIFICLKIFPSEHSSILVMLHLLEIVLQVVACRDFKAAVFLPVIIQFESTLPVQLSS